MTLAADPEMGVQEFAVEVICTGLHASGFGQLGDGRSFSFHVERQALVVEIYRPRLSSVVPGEEDIVAVASKKLADIDFTDERSITAAVRDAVADATPVPRPSR